MRAARDAAAPAGTVAGGRCAAPLTPLRVWWRRNPVYRRLLKGQLADHIVFHPWDALPRRLEEADSLLRGRFRFYGVSVDVPDGVSVFDLPPPTPAWHMALHSFALAAGACPTPAATMRASLPPT